MVSRPVAGYALLAVWAAAMGAFAVADLPISLAFVDSDSGWAMFVQHVGEVPGLLCACVAMVVLSTHRPRERPFASWGTLVILGVLTAFLFNYCLFLLVGHLREGAAFFDDHGLTLFACLSLGVIIVQKAVLDRLRFSPPARRWGWLTFWTTLLAILAVVVVMKTIWGRVRFRDLDLFMTEFTPWYAPQGITGERSFPSGHTLWGWVPLGLIVLIPAQRVTRRRVIAGLLIAWGIFVALGRVRVGAHYASDVSASTAAVIGLYWVLSARLGRFTVTPSADSAYGLGEHGGARDAAIGDCTDDAGPDVEPGGLRR